MTSLKRHRISEKFYSCSSFVQLPINDFPNPQEEDYMQLLDKQYIDGGKNLSMGQKQLVCIIRALVKKHKILLMDEATSNIDQYTDRKIQNILKRECKDTTVGKQLCLFCMYHSPYSLLLIQPEVSQNLANSSNKLPLFKTNNSDDRAQNRDHHPLRSDLRA